ncbi:hypothetical protein L596_011522 [Steinernema carpocapsae]|uniref:Amino acid transporter transmembrane domain-containing protein n=1 Tax=Steinernema carpocapsae TaxID=34508 RepID=A0A4U5NU60_STECR|nr:hypothetical protein L596_011522 [Steinernema carpocapsae]
MVADSTPRNNVFTIGSENGLKQAEFEKSHGLHWIVTALFVVGQVAGAGFVAFPTALVQTQFWPGLFIMFMVCLLAAYSAYALGEGWNIMQKRWPEYREHCRKPYAEMGFRAMGSKIKNLVSVCLDANQFGSAVIYLLLSSKNIQDSIKAFSGYNFNFCIVVLILALFILPLTFLKSPEDFWWAVVLAMCTTSAAAVLIVVGGSKDYETCHPYKEMPEFSFTQYFLALGTFLFAYGGHASFPTIQHDMKKPSDFKKSVVLAFIILQALYLPISTTGYLVYGDSLRDSIINAIQTVWIQQALNILITAHCVLALTIIFNPLNQEMEEIFDVPHHFGIKRVFVRTAMMVAVVFVAESIPTFGPVLNLLGGSALMLTSLVFPCLFYVFLLSSQKKTEEGSKDADEAPSIQEVFEKAPKTTLAICCFIVVFALVGGGAATYSAIRELSTTHFEYPCYVAPFLDVKGVNSEQGHTNCCGHFSNVTWADSEACTAFRSFFN